MSTQLLLILIFLIGIVSVYFAAKAGAKQRTKFYSERKKAAQTTESEASGEKESTLTAGGTIDNKEEIPGEVLAAIFMALHEEQKITHDYENTVLTMDRVVRNYSPWNSKFYGLRQLPRR